MLDVNTQDFLSWCANNPLEIEDSLENTVTNYNLYWIKQTLNNN